LLKPSVGPTLAENTGQGLDLLILVLGVHHLRPVVAEQPSQHLPQADVNRDTAAGMSGSRNAGSSLSRVG
jgi:CTP:molybdopterin cytidylyltransferase MocA